MNKFVILGVLLCLSSCRPAADNAAKPQGTPVPVLTVTTTPVTLRPIQKRIQVTGSVMARDLLTLQPAINGLKVLAVHVDEGDFVRKGQVLVSFDDRLVKAQLRSAQARLSSAQAQLKKTRHPNRSQEIARLRAALNQAQATLDNARSNATRFDQLRQEGVVTQADWEGRKMALQTAEATVKQQREVLNLALAGSRVEDIHMSQSSVTDLGAQMHQLQIQLDQSRMLAPASGLILSRGVNIGELSAPGSRFFTMIKDGQLEFQAQVTEADLFQIAVGAPVAMSSDANPQIKAEGHVRRLSPQIDPASRQGIAKIAVAPGSGFRVGQFVRGEIHLGQVQTLVIPLKAVVSKEGVSQVYILDQNRARARVVKLGIQNNTLVEVQDGLRLNEQLIEDGVGFLKDGDYVKVVPRSRGAKS